MKKFLLLAPLLILLQGCGATMTSYEPSFDNVQRLKQNPALQPVSQAQVTAASGQGWLMVRANPINSPAGSIPAHVQAALTQELSLAGLLNQSAPRRLDVLLVKSELTAGVGSGHGTLAARFTVVKNDAVVYDATKEVTSVWSSSFFGPIAVLNATNAYNPLVRDLLKALYSDPLFIQALK
ncbi:hypothetical protein AO268_02305 [Pseudomonas sp. ICMP 8385]|uniref:hypothetical protein n=1 Tax=Pseudomonas sp. ICMP 8385 TaxID=1718920 RepID=UPI000C068AFD|nr:hypothetical protein [Pseudomonas sp. ICMP 8385]PHN58638.1 hypothetical protein AO268_02305 [Pseudomonas sp. ICMP 8385]